MLENLNKDNEKILPDIYVVNLGDSARIISFEISEKLRDEGFKVGLNMEGSSFKSQMKKADKSGAKIALIIGDNEVENKIIQVKLIRNEGLQKAVNIDDIIPYIKEKINFEK